jgi:hypothetical protein
VCERERERERERESSSILETFGITFVWVKQPKMKTTKVFEMSRTSF